MSICNCPTVGMDGIYDAEQKRAVDQFLKSLAPDGALAHSDWSLLSLTDMAEAGNDLETIRSSVPFRGGACSRSMRCCGVCTRQCTHRCVQDCLHRLFIWTKMVETMPEDRVPLSLKLIVNQKFESHEQLSWVVGEILSRNTNSSLKEYMEAEGLRPEENPYKMDYSPQVDVDPSTGKRRVNPNTGELVIRTWPSSGLCPYCLPNVTHDRRFAKK